MNSTIKNICDNTMNLKVREYAKTLIANKGKLFKAVFKKIDGSLREMVFTVSSNWNPLNGISTSDWGKGMIATKCGKNMATVCEKISDGTFRPRTLNLSTITSLSVL